MIELFQIIQIPLNLIEKILNFEILDNIQIFNLIYTLITIKFIKKLMKV